MNDDPSKKRLGRGLAALIGEIDKSLSQISTPTVYADTSVSIECISPNPKNPRRSFSESDLSELTQSIRKHGVVQPVIVRPDQRPGYFQIVAGERRWRAAQRAGLMQIPVIIKEVNDCTALEIAIIENVQRSDLNPIEEAVGYQKLIDEHHYTQADLGQIIGKSRSHVANTLRLLKLPDGVRKMLLEGELSAGHARTLINAENPDELAKHILSENLSVRQAEALSQNPEIQSARSTASSPTPKDQDTVALEKLLTDIIGLKVLISHKEKGGELRISYKTLDQLDKLCRSLQESSSLSFLHSAISSE